MKEFYNWAWPTLTQRMNVFMAEPVGPPTPVCLMLTPSVLASESVFLPVHTGGLTERLLSFPTPHPASWPSQWPWCLWAWFRSGGNELNLPEDEVESVKCVVDRGQFKSAVLFELTDGLKKRLWDHGFVKQSPRKVLSISLSLSTSFSALYRHLH